MKNWIGQSTIPIFKGWTGPDVMPLESGGNLKNKKFQFKKKLI